MIKNNYVKKVFDDFCKKNQNQNEYIQACQEILESLQLYIEKEPYVEKNHLLIEDIVFSIIVQLVHIKVD